MRLTIHYDSSWRNSFLQGSNNEPLDKKGRKFIGSMTELKKEGNFIPRTITKDTVMGVLNRLVGDQRKLYQSREANDYYFKGIEDKVTFVDSHPKYVNTQEVVYIRNVTGSEDQNSFTGSIRTNDPIFKSDYSEKLWGVLALEFDELLSLIVDEKYQIKTVLELNPISVIEKLEELNKLKAIEVKDQVESALKLMQSTFPEVDYKLTTKGLIMPISFYTSALYIQVKRLAKEYDLSSALTKSGGLSGISKRGFTKKDFMVKYTTGGKKLVFGNPYQLKERVTGQGEVTSLLTKSSGQLDIIVDVSYEQAQKIRQDIYDAGVSSFYLGKKGLAWLDEKISLEES
jgi:hypothetical protein